MSKEDTIVMYEINVKISPVRSGCRTLKMVTASKKSSSRSSILHPYGPSSFVFLIFAGWDQEIKEKILPWHIFLILGCGMPWIIKLTAVLVFVVLRPLKETLILYPARYYLCFSSSSGSGR